MAISDFLYKVLSKADSRVSPSRALISRVKVRNALVGAIEPILCLQHFERFVGGRSLRVSEKWTDIVEIQFIKAVGLPANSPSMHIGRYLHFVPEDAISGPVPEKNGRAYLTVERCHLRKTIFKSVRQRETKSPNVWFVGDRADYLNECASQLRLATQEEVIPWFSKFDQLEMLLELFMSGQPDIEGLLTDRLMRGTWNFGNYFSRHVVGGFVALESGHYAVAASLLGRVLCDGGVVGKGGKISPLPTATVESIRRAVELASERLT